jgi:hypothetical protein
MHAETTRQENTTNLPLALGMALVVGLGVAWGTVGRRREAHERPAEDDRHTALVTYLLERLSGADAAIRVVERLRRAQPDERALFDWLYNEFEADHQVVQAILTMLGASSGSPTRLLGQVSGSVLERLAGGTAGDLSLFRTLEALAIGGQGKRCMWRVLQILRPALQLPGTRSLPDLEAAAVRQWEAIEQRRMLVVPRTFATTARAPRD